MVSTEPVTATSAASAAASGSAPRRAAREATAEELHRDADARLASLRLDDTPAQVAALGSPNRYLRAGALTRLAEHAPALSVEALELVVALTNDHGRVTSGSCLKYESGGPPRGQGSMYHAAVCARHHTQTVAERAESVLAHADPAALALASTRQLAKQPALLQPLSALTRDRRAELAPPLQRVLVDANRTGRAAELDAGLRLLAHVALERAESGTVEVLRRIAREPRPTRALRATFVLLAMTYSEPPHAFAREGYDVLRAKLKSSLGASCVPNGAECLSTHSVLSEIREMREAAEPLLAELVGLLESDDETIRIASLLVMKSMGVKARSAVPRLVALLTQHTRSAPEETSDVHFILETLATTRAAPSTVKGAVLRVVRKHPQRFDEAASVLATLRASLGPAERTLLRRAYDEQCADAGSVYMFSLGNDDRCATAADHLKRLGVRTD